jgi:hypothetical protein
VSWKQYARAAEAASRRRRRAEERQAIREHRLLEKSAREWAKEEAKQQAAGEVARFENYLELLVSLHKDCGESWDWRALAVVPPPSVPGRSKRRETDAADALQAYTPGFFERVFGGAKKRQAALEADLEAARAADLSEYESALQEQQAAAAVRNFRRKIAPAILAGDPSVYAQALKHAGAFDDVSSFQTKVTIANLESDVITLTCEIMDGEIVPPDEIKLTASGKLSTKAMPAGRYWSLYQHHVCSCALRSANETFAVLPVSRVIVNIGTVRVNTATGHPEMATVLAVHFSRNVLQGLNLDNIDSFDAMKNFPHRMKLKKTAGFEAVTPMTSDEQWVTT